MFALSERIQLPGNLIIINLFNLDGETKRVDAILISTSSGYQKDNVRVIKSQRSHLKFIERKDIALNGYLRPSSDAVLHMSRIKCE